MLDDERCAFIYSVHEEVCIVAASRTAKPGHGSFMQHGVDGHTWHALVVLCAVLLHHQLVASHVYKGRTKQTVGDIQSLFCSLLLVGIWPFSGQCLAFGDRLAAVKLVS
jgi:hypothetical protein